MLANAIQLFLINFWNVKSRDCIVFPSLPCIFFVIIGVMPNKTYRKKTPITLISNEWIIIIILTQAYTYMQIKMMMRMNVINFMNFYKVDGPVLLWHPICKCSSIMQIFIYTLCSAGKSRRNFHHKFFERENYRLYSYYSTSFSTISLLHIIIGAMPFRKGKEELQLY